MLSTREIRKTVITTNGITLNIFPGTPGIKYRGINVAIFVKILKTTGTVISRTPLTAACKKGMPF